MRRVDKFIMDRIESKNVFVRYIILAITLLISALYYNILVKPCKIVSGGTGGVATILYHTLGFDPALVILIISLILGIISFIFLGKEKSFSVLFIAIVYPLFVSFTDDLTGVVLLEQGDILIASIFAGVLSGITSGIVLKIGFSTGGFNVLSLILYKYKKISVSLIDMIINISIIGIGVYFFGITSALYAIVYIFVGRIFVDRILLGISKDKKFYIISSKYEEIKRYIKEDLNHGVTVFDTTGGSVKLKQKLLMTVVPTSSYFELKQVVKEIDSKAFIVITDSYEVKGGK